MSKSKIMLCLVNLCLILMFIPNSTVSAPADIDLARSTGEIRGTVSYCNIPNLEGVEVFIPGKSFHAYTGPSGEFVLSYVPEGTWNLVYMRNGQRIGSTSGIQVFRRQATDLNPGPVISCNDIDGDGYNIAQGDCDDSNPRIFPGAPEFCGDGLDNNCNGTADESCPECTDIDGDGFYAQLGCGFVDCDETSPAVNPGALESCGDGTDNNCDGQIDEDTAYNAVTFYFDNDGDGVGTEVTSVTGCVPPDGYVPSGGDCDDANSSIYPGSQELCNGIDDNCDELIDNACSNRVCTDSEVADFEACLTECTSSSDMLTCTQICLDVVSSSCGDGILQLGVCVIGNGCIEPGNIDITLGSICAYDNCFAEWEPVFGNFVPTECTDGETRSCGSNIGECSPGTQACINGRWDSTCTGATGPSPEICDGLDNSCDGQIDEDCSNCFIQSDCSLDELCIDGQCVFNEGGCTLEQAGEVRECSVGNGYGECFGTETCDPEIGWLGCTAMTPSPEICDGFDNDCDGQIDEGVC